ncbi:MAG: hypothetical protein KDA78_18945, partial [Planctomycetaceae bacterium]|nr:hypothetical protein [Planctomycetaceae bacterium]
RKAPLSAIVTMIAQQHGLNVVISDDTDTEVTMSLSNTSLRDALDTIVAASGCTWVQQRDIIIVTKISAEKAVQAHVQGRQVRVIPLNFISASDAQAVVSGLLSPVGKIFIHQSDPTDKLKARETVIVEDLPESLARIEQYIATVDQPPRQVLIEAHILQVVLDDSCRHGVNLSYLTQIAGADFTISSGGFANPMASPALLIDIDGSKLNNVVEAIRDTTDSKTLASPKVLVLNGQEAKIQIGERLGFQVTTTTQTSTVQNVQFLDTGVVLSVTPQITQDGQILMKVKPEVSTGNVNPLTGLPDKETAEVDTTVMLPDGHGIVIGGLIQELDAVRQSKIPFFGDLRYIGRAFQRRTKTKERTEIIIALVPRILPYDPAYRCYEESNYQRATSPLLYGPLISAPRPEPQLFDAINNPRHWRRGAPVMNDCQDCQICPEPVLGQGYSAGFPEPMITPSLNTHSQTFTPVP